MRIWMWLVATAVVVAGACSPMAAQPTAVNPSSSSPAITAITDATCDTTKPPKVPHVALGQRLFVTVDDAGTAAPSSYVLFLNGRPVPGLDASLARCRPSDAPALVFRLRYTDANAATWRALLGAPTRLSIQVTVALGTMTSRGTLPATPTIFAGKNSDTIALAVTSWWRAIGALIAIAIVVSTVWLSARHSALLRDNLLPQIPPGRQTYSLGRWQMAFWFTLVFASFVALYVVLLDFNTITQQDLWLVGISGTTGVAAIAVDIAKDTPADAANRGLRALGLNTYADVIKVQQEVAKKTAELAGIDPTTSPALAKKLGLEINDRNLLVQTYERTIRPFESEGWFRDLTTDMNGAALHRLQTLFWTLALGVVFVIGVYTDLAMPQFSATLLLLTGVSSAGYIGFKYPEPQQ